MRFGTRRTIAAIALASSAIVTLAGCSLFVAPGSASPTISGTHVDVSENEFSLTLSRTTFAPGTYIFAVTNDGGTQHNLFINGPGVDNQATPTLAPNQTAWLTVTLEKGVYDLWSNVNDDKEAGMDVQITVR